MQMFFSVMLPKLLTVGLPGLLALQKKIHTSYNAVNNISNNISTQLFVIVIISKNISSINLKNM